MGECGEVLTILVIFRNLQLLLQFIYGTHRVFDKDDIEERKIQLIFSNGRSKQSRTPIILACF